MMSRLLSWRRFLSPRKRLEWFPPFWFMGVKVLELADDWSVARFRLPLNAFSKNPGGCMFGGNQASLADPIAALACVKRFPDYSVWTRSMEIDFLREGSSDLELRFAFPQELDHHIRQELAEKGRCTPTFEYGLYRADGEMCARVINRVAIRPKGYAGR